MTNNELKIVYYCFFELAKEIAGENKVYAENIAKGKFWTFASRIQLSDWEVQKILANV